MQELTGFQYNCVSPFGMKQDIPILIAKSIQNRKFVYMGGGSETMKVGMSVLDLAKFGAFAQVTDDRPNGAAGGLES